MLVKGLQPFSVYAARFRINPMALSALKSVEKQIPDLSKMLEDPRHLVKGFVTLTYSPNVPRELKAKTVDLHRAQVLPDVLQRSILLPLLHAPLSPSLPLSLPLFLSNRRPFPCIRLFKRHYRRSPYVLLFFSVAVESQLEIQW